METNEIQKKQKKGFSSFLIKNNTYVMLIGLFIVCIIISPDFFNEANLVNIGRQSAGDIIIALGMLFVILTGGIDLSVGSVAALGSVMVAFALTTHEMGMGMAILLPILCGLALGLATGVLIAYAKMAPFIASLAMMTIAKGLAFMISNGQPVITPENTIGVLGTHMVGPVPTLVILAVAVIVLFWVVEKYTAFGRIVIAIGSNETAVRLAGIPVRKYKMSVYAISGICAAVAGIIAASRTAIGTPIIGTGWELNAIAACVIGGASLSGGEGSSVKAVVGVLVLALIGNIMNLLAVPSYPQDVIKGLIIIGSVLLQTFTSEKKSKGF
ncbi:MAG: ABC transporter permease [Christensenella sp.]|uniref:ABC transporter permease n=1 Tax=Christensenella sp. TaxID=1935934 RepID=UPI002B1F4629|nr:ABC transporter permease [Christensenella sp.]MEA5004163.1 ABC transporter permease [Christensenella sp.]